MEKTIKDGVLKDLELEDFVWMCCSLLILFWLVLVSSDCRHSFIFFMRFALEQLVLLLCLVSMFLAFSEGFFGYPSSRIRDFVSLDFSGNQI